ncbi:hypothetical protein APK89_01 [Acinetobacter phage vB_AbaP_APK89]|uniref:Uncharacterized protein n=1 Tax=Acinetobacter phage vB_AbaP_APK89 TaxID=2675228 RepID=A0A6M3AJE9_9CAUD|nr:hypothetical protein APK89_01 [Acinetobacter phage vB_AbaP_APK89]
MDDLYVILQRYQADIEFTIDIDKAITDFNNDAERTDYGIIHDAYAFFDHYSFSVSA